MADTEGTSDPVADPRWLLLPSVVCVLQGAAFGILAASLAWIAWRRPVHDSSAAATSVYFTLIAVVLVVVGAAIGRRRRWARGPVVVIELIVVLIAVANAGLDSWIGWVMLVPALAALLTVLRPSVVASLRSAGD